MPVIANGGYYGAPGVTAAGAYGATPADMLYSLRNQGWSDQQIMDTYGPDDPIVRIMQLENQYNQAQPGANGYRYQYPQPAPAPAPAQPSYTAADLEAQYNAAFGAPAGQSGGPGVTQNIPFRDQPTYTPYGAALPVEQALDVTRQQMAHAGTLQGLGDVISQSLGYRW